MSTDKPPEYAMYRVSTDGSRRERLRPETFQFGYGGVFWAPDQSGALIVLKETDSDTEAWFWAPADGGQPLVKFQIGGEPFSWGALSTGASAPIAIAPPSAAPLIPTTTIAPATAAAMTRLSAPLAADLDSIQIQAEPRWAVCGVCCSVCEREQQHAL